MSVRIRFAGALICMGGLGLALGPFFGTVWPGVVLCGMSLLPLAMETWLGRDGSEIQSLVVMGGLLAKHAEALLEMQKRIDEQHEQINSLRTAVNMRGIMGG